MTRIDLGNVKGSKGDAIQIKDLTSVEKKELLAYSNLELTDKEIQEAFNKLTDSQQDRIKGDKGDKGDKGTLDYEVCSQNPLNTYYNHIIKAYYDSQAKEFHKSPVENSPNIISIIEGYYDDGKFYEDANLTNEMELMENTIYHDLTNQEDYHSHNGSLMLESEFTYVDISKDEEKIKGYYNSANSQFYLERNFETLIEGNDEKEYLDLITGDTYNYNGFVWTRVEPVYDAYKYDTDDGFVLYNGGKVPIPTKLYIYNPTGETGEHDNQVNDIYFYIESVIEDVRYGRFINLFNSEISNSLTVNTIGNVDIIKNSNGDVLLEFYVNNFFKDIVEIENINDLDEGEEDKIYVDSEGKAYRWTGSSFVEITTFDLDSRISTLEDISVTRNYLDTLTWTKEDIIDFAHTHSISDVDELEDRLNSFDEDSINNMSATIESLKESKVDKVTGKQLSTNDFTNQYKYWVESSYYDELTRVHIYYAEGNDESDNVWVQQVGSVAQLRGSWKTVQSISTTNKLLIGKFSRLTPEQDITTIQAGNGKNTYQLTVTTDGELYIQNYGINTVTSIPSGTTLYINTVWVTPY